MVVPGFVSIVPSIQTVMGITIMLQRFSDKSCIKPHCYRSFLFFFTVAASAKATALTVVNEDKLIATLLLKQILVVIGSSSVNSTYSTS